MPFLLLAQTNDTTIGIQWTTNLSWEQIKQKAKAENKYIFLDCFATWCLPCKQMEKDVFSKAQVGEYFNDKFISVRVQMDKTEKDEVFVKNWYGDAAAIYKKYKIIVFPSFLFFKPDGSIVYKDRGYKGPNETLKTAKLATIKGRKFDDPYKKFDAFTEAYKKGQKNYSKMPEMIKKAKEIGEGTTYRMLSKDYFDYLSKAQKKTWYSKANIEFVASNLNDSKTKFFEMFYPDGVRVDKIMGKKEFSRYTVDRIINNEIMMPYLDSFRKQHTKRMILSGIEPSWDSIYRVVANIYNDDFASRSIRKGKHRFYWIAQQQVDSSYMSAFLKTMSEMIENRDMDPDDDNTDVWMNTAAWEIFKESGDAIAIKFATQWIQEMISRNNAYRRFKTQFMILDTYANLLYKSTLLFNTNQLTEALLWEKKALSEAINQDAPEDLVLEIKSTIEKMNKQIPTW